MVFLNYDGPLLSTSFNTVQGWKTQVGLSYTKRDEEKRTFTRIGSRFDYGFSENKLRVTGSYAHKFNNINNSMLTIFGGSSVNQFNNATPISNIVNSVSSLFFRNNFMKLYEKNFVAAYFGREITNGLNLNVTAEYSERKPLWNTTDYSVIKSDDVYSSNNPLRPNSTTSSAFQKHNLVKGSVLMRIKFGQHYWTRPDGKYNIGNDNYPTIYVGYDKTFAATNKKYEYDLISGRITHSLTLGNKGELQMNLKGGNFFQRQ